jgi:hypothetical protein
MDDFWNVSRTVTEGYKVWLAFGGVALALAWPRLKAQLAMQLLVALSLLSVANYARWGEESLLKKVDTYDLIHYYLNAKYFDELGYYDLYPACILADHDNKGPYFEEGKQYMAQSDAGHSFEPIAHAVVRGRIVRDTRFTPDRWRDFQHDFLHLQREVYGMNSKLWRQMIQDHGFNGTLPWLLVAQPMATLVPVERVKWLGQLDTLLLVSAFGAIAWAYGASTAWWAVFFLTVCYSLRWPTVSWVFLRYDWIFALLVAMAALKKGHHVLAGVLAGYSTVLRLFPIVWMWGPLFRGLGDLRGRVVNKQLVAMAAAFLLTIVGFQLASFARFGTEQAQVHLENMVDHNKAEQLSSRRIGLALALPYRGELLPKYIEPERKQKVADQKPLRYGIAGFFILVMGWGLRNARDDEAFGFGFLPFFLLTTASYYYYIGRVTLAVIHASDLSKWRNRIGLSWLFLLEFFSNWAETNHPGHRVYLVGMLAWGLAVYTTVMCVWMLWEAQQSDRGEPQLEPAAAA